MHERFAACAKRNQVLEEEVHKVTKIAQGASKIQSKLARKLNEETTQRLTAEIKLARAETELAKLRAHMIKMKCKEEAYLAAMELVQNQAHRNLKTWMESDPTQVRKIQECQPAIRKEDSSLIPTESQVKECLLRNLPSSIGTEEELRTVTTADEISPENYPGGS